jgi:hypothetical protein
LPEVFFKGGNARWRQSEVTAYPEVETDARGGALFAYLSLPFGEAGMRNLILREPPSACFRIRGIGGSMKIARFFLVLPLLYAWVSAAQVCEDSVLDPATISVLHLKSEGTHTEAGNVSAVMDRKTRGLAKIFIVRCFVCVLKTPPATQVIYEHDAETRLSLNNIFQKLLQSTPVLQANAAFRRV